MSHVVCKFGGTSMADAAQIKKVCEIIKADPKRKYVVVSAPGKRFSEDRKVTDLFYLAQDTATNGLDVKPVMDLISKRYADIIKGLDILDLDLTPELNDISSQLATAGADYAASRGEYLNGKIFAHYLKASFVDPADCIFFKANGLLDEDKTYSTLGNALKGEGLFIVPGFYGQSSVGSIKTFSRGGSDITGSVVARAVQAELYENWTDVSGLLMADPRVVKDPAKVKEITYQELRELSYSGASVLHDEAIIPARQAGIPIVIRNTNDPSHPGTRIVVERKVPEGQYIAGIAGRKGFESIYIRKALLNKVVGFAHRFLEIFANYGVNFEHMPSGIDTISVVVSSDAVAPYRDSIIEDIHQQLKVDELDINKDLALVAVVGQGMAHRHGIAARVFSALDKAQVNVRLIDQGSSELNIIIGVDAGDYEKTIQAIYQAFVIK